LFFAVSFSGLGEGTKELRPDEADHGSLHISKKSQFTKFGQYGAAPEQQIKINVASTDETIYFGLNNEKEAGGFISGVPYRIVSPSGNIVFTSVMQNSGEGSISTWTEAVSGPIELGNAQGYDAIELKPAEIGDYVLEFDISALDVDDEMQLPLFDVTVAGADNIAIPGRLHSQGWQLSTGDLDNPFLGKVYPYDDTYKIVYEVDLNKTNPYTFVINFNSSGTGNTGNHLDDRKSKEGNFTFPEYEVFLNPPDSTIYPTATIDNSFSGTSIKTDCFGNAYCLNFTTGAKGILDGFIDINNNTVFDGNDVSFSEEFSKPGTKCISWDGLDAKGNDVSGTEVKVYASFGFGMINFPIYDVEHNKNGYKVKVMSPADYPDPLIFWDDSDIDTGSPLDGLVNLIGCNSSGSEGCHRWEDRGNSGSQETINSWWYNQLDFATLILPIKEQSKVKLSYSPGVLNAHDTTVCKGDSLALFVFNDGISHYNKALYNYEWYFNASLLQSDTGQVKFSADAPGTLVIKAIDKSNLSCFSSDTIAINTEKPVEIKAVVTDPLCAGMKGAVAVTIINAPPAPVFTWADFPAEATGNISNIVPGTYALSIRDTLFSKNCALDTAFTVKPALPLILDSVITQATFCFEAKGTAFVFMKDKSFTYSYSWDSKSYVSTDNASNLERGNHTVTVKTTEGCVLDTSFSVSEKPFSISVLKKDEKCHNQKGEIELIVPGTNLITDWADFSTNDTKIEDLAAGSYNVTVSAPLNPSCKVDTTISIVNADNFPKISQLLIEPSSCSAPSGVVSLQMPTDGQDYIFSWNHAVFTQKESMGDLPIGVVNIQVKAIGSDCVLDSSVTIPASKQVDISTTDEVCAGQNGTVKVLVSDPNATLVWKDTGGNLPERDQLKMGIYAFKLNNSKYPECTIDTFAVVQASAYTIPVEFTYAPSVPPIEPGQLIAFESNIALSDSILWDFGDTFSSIENRPYHSYTADGIFTVSLFVKDQNGCSGESERSITIESIIPCEATLANAFSPNNDLQNDAIGVLGTVHSMDLKIFNRWGELIFRGNSVQDRWDGTYRGKEAPLGVYPYILDYTCLLYDNTIKRMNKVGQITLIR